MHNKIKVTLKLRQRLMEIQTHLAEHYSLFVQDQRAHVHSTSSLTDKFSNALWKPLILIELSLV